MAEKELQMTGSNSVAALLANKILEHLPRGFHCPKRRGDGQQCGLHRVCVDRLLLGVVDRRFRQFREDHLSAFADNPVPQRLAAIEHAVGVRVDHYDHRPRAPVNSPSSGFPRGIRGKSSTRICKSTASWR